MSASAPSRPPPAAGARKRQREEKKEAPDVAPSESKGGVVALPVAPAAEAAAKSAPDDVRDETVKRLKSELKELKKMRPRAATAEQATDMVYLYKTLQLERAEEQAKHPTRKLPAGRFQQRVSAMLGYSSQVVSRFFKEFNDRRAFTERLPPGNYKRKKSRLGDSIDALEAVRSVVNEARAEGRRLSSKRVLEALTARGLIDFDRSKPVAERSAMRVVMRYLRTHGFVLRARSAWAEPEPLRAQRFEYLEELERVRALPPDKQPRLVYCSVVRIERSGRVSQLWLMGAVAARDPRVPVDVEAAATPEQEARALDETFVAVEMKPAASNPLARFPSEALSEWLRSKLLPTLKQPSLIVLSGVSAQIATPASSRAIDALDMPALRAKADELKLPLPPRVGRDALRRLVRAYLDAAAEPELASTARLAGHAVAFLPRHHADLQPVEHLWQQLRDRLASTVNAKEATEVLRGTLAAISQQDAKAALKWTQRVRQNEVALLRTARLEALRRAGQAGNAQSDGEAEEEGGEDEEEEEEEEEDEGEDEEDDEEGAAGGLGDDASDATDQ